MRRWNVSILPCAAQTKPLLLPVAKRLQLNYSEENLKQARAALERLYTALRGTDKTVAPAGGEAFEARFIEAMNDDFNTPEAYSVLFDMAREVNRLKAEDMAAANAMASHLRKLSAVLGLLVRRWNVSTLRCAAQTKPLRLPVAKRLKRALSRR